MGVQSVSGGYYDDQGNLVDPGYGTSSQLFPSYAPTGGNYDPTYTLDPPPNFNPLSPDDVSNFSFIQSPSSPPSSSSSFSIPASYFQAGASFLGGFGSYMKGIETQQADDYNAQLALTQGQFQVEEIGDEEVQTLSTQRAMYAKAGVEQSGSTLDTALATATQYEYSKEVATYNAQSQANMDIYEGKIAKSQGEMGLAMGLLSGAAKLI